MKKMKMACGCMMVVENDHDRMNVGSMKCMKCVRKNFPWFMQGDPDMGSRKNWSKDAGKWNFHPVVRGTGKWEWSKTDFSAGEVCSVPVWVAAN